MWTHTTLPLRTVSSPLSTSWKTLSVLLGVPSFSPPYFSCPPSLLLPPTLPISHMPTAFEKVVYYRGQEYHTQLVDTAGQVYWSHDCVKLHVGIALHLPPLSSPSLPLLSLPPSSSFPPTHPSQDEYFILPQSYTLGIHGYILVYSVTSMKRCMCVWGGGGGGWRVERECALNSSV